MITCMTVTPGAEASQRVAAEIRAEMARQQMTQTTLAKELGVVRQWLYRRLSGETPLTIDDVANIAQALGVPASNFTDAVDRD